MAENVYFHLICFLLFDFFLMEILRVGSLNINGMRDGRKNEVLSDIINLKDLSVKVLQETHSTCSNEVNVSGYVCNHGSPSGERDTASPRGRYGERPQRDSVWRYICKNTTCWPATAHDVTTGVPQYKCHRENTSSASSSEACVRSMARSLGDAVSRSPLGEPWLHT